MLKMFRQINFKKIHQIQERVMSGGIKYNLDFLSRSLLQGQWKS
jgi:hypothetical protein